MSTFREGDTIEIPYALLDADGSTVTVGAGDSLKLLIAPKPPNDVTPAEAAADLVFTPDDAEITQEEVTIGSVTAQGYLFASAAIPAGKWVYEWQYAADDGTGDTERGSFEVLRRIVEASS